MNKRYRKTKYIRVTGSLLLVLLSLFWLSGCVNTEPQIITSVTLAPTSVPTDTPAPSELAESTPEATVAPTNVPDDKTDDLGNVVNSANHYTRYLTFSDILVYEENGDTFVDCIVTNSYPSAIVCALDIAFFDEESTEVARGQLQTRDGKYLLVLESGETVLFAHILTDMVLLDFEFELEFDMETGIHPQTVGE